MRLRTTLGTTLASLAFVATLAGCEPRPPTVSAPHAVHAVGDHQRPRGPGLARRGFLDPRVARGLARITRTGTVRVGEGDQSHPGRPLRQRPGSGRHPHRGGCQLQRGPPLACRGLERKPLPRGLRRHQPLCRRQLRARRLCRSVDGTRDRPLRSRAPGVGHVGAGAGQRRLAVLRGVGVRLRPASPRDPDPANGQRAVRTGADLDLRRTRTRRGGGVGWCSFPGGLGGPARRHLGHPGHTGDGVGRDPGHGGQAGVRGAGGPVGSGRRRPPRRIPRGLAGRAHRQRRRAGRPGDRCRGVARSDRHRGGRRGWSAGLAGGGVELQPVPGGLGSRHQRPRGPGVGRGGRARPLGVPRVRGPGSPDHPGCRETWGEGHHRVDRRSEPGRRQRHLRSPGVGSLGVTRRGSVDLPGPGAPALSGRGLQRQRLLRGVGRSPGSRAPRHLRGQGQPWRGDAGSGRHRHQPGRG